MMVVLMYAMYVQMQIVPTPANSQGSHTDTQCNACHYDLERETFCQWKVLMQQVVCICDTAVNAAGKR